MSIPSKRIRDAYNLRAVDIVFFATEVKIKFITLDYKEHKLIFDSRECIGDSPEAFWIWVYKKVDEEIQPYLI